MSDDGEVKYVWAVEWHNPFAQNKRGMVFYDVTLLPGVTEEELGKFLAEEGFPAVDGILTRAVRFEQQYLLRHSEEEGPDPLSSIQKEGVAEKLGSLCKHTTDKSFYVVMSSGTASEE
ncbi:MAG: hypothetical protein DMF53_20785 [Acidobacteria bacterium]|nr:MAG: hypothetical protein DMF53_20785 [Acidobacteriota bacterium]